jgi:hypothetical protein
MADGVAITAGSGTTILTDDTGAGGHAQVVKLAISTDGSATLIPAEATNGLDVDVTRVIPGTTATALGKAEDAAHNDGDTGVLMLAVRNGTAPGSDGDYAALITATNGGLKVGGCQNHDDVDAGGPVKIGMRAIAHGANPTAVAAADRTDWLANRAGVPWVIGGHPNVVTLKHTNITTAVTDAAIITVGAGTKIVVTRLSVTLDSASTVFPSVAIGFGATTTPTTTGVLASHGGVPAGGGFTIGDGSGILGVGADNDDLRVTTTGNATGNGLQITVSYYTIES